MNMKINKEKEKAHAQKVVESFRKYNLSLDKGTANYYGYLGVWAWDLVKD